LHQRAPHKKGGAESRASGPWVRELRGVSELRSDRSEDRRDAAAGRLHRADRDERDEGDEQGVLEQVLAFFIACERLQCGYELHGDPPVVVHSDKGRTTPRWPAAWRSRRKSS